LAPVDAAPPARWYEVRGNARIDPYRSFRIDYAGIFEPLVGLPAADVIAALTAELPARWTRSYEEMVTRPTRLLEVQLDDNAYLFDLASSAGGPVTKRMPDDRVVVAWGTSRAADEGRDDNRLKGMPTRPGMQRGHVVSHAQGGGLDINILPQRPDVNQIRRWSPHGYRWRAMEQYCADHPGTFFFVRPLYGDDSWVPQGMEYGVLKSPTELDVKRFPN
jgi:hypothetical protein